MSIIKEQQKPHDPLPGEHANAKLSGWEAYHANSKTLSFKHSSNRSKKHEQKRL